MKSKHLSLAAGAVLAASTMMIGGSTVRAEELPQTKAQQQFSATKGFAAPALAEFRRTFPPGPSHRHHHGVRGGAVQWRRPGDGLEPFALES